MENKGPIRCVVLDDEYLAVKLISGYVQRTIGLALALSTTNANEALAIIQQGQADLIFLDVQMPDITGIELMHLTRNDNIKVILITAYAQYALDGYEYDIVDYLLKPITYERFILAVNKAKARLHSSSQQHIAQDFLFIKTEYRLQKVALNSIMYLEALGDYIAFHTTGGKILSLERMKNRSELLPQKNFLRIHKSYIINIDHISFIERGRVVINKEYLPVGETFKETVRAKLGI